MNRPETQSRLRRRVGKYETIKTAIRDSILNGDINAGDKVPSQAELVKTYGVSITTVREAVSALVHEGLLYRVHGSGTYVAEVKKKPKMIAVIVPHIYDSSSPGEVMDYDIMAPLVSAIEAESRRQEAYILLLLDHDRPEIEHKILLDIYTHSVDGAIVFPLASNENLKPLSKLCQSGIPVVLVDRSVTGIEADYVITDNHAGAYNAVKKIAEFGYKRLVYVTLKPDTTTEKIRLNGVMAASEDCMDLSIVTVKWKNIYRTVIESLAGCDEPVAIFASSSGLLTPAWGAAKELGRNGSNTLLAGFDKMHHALNTDCKKIQVIQKLGTIGKTSVEILIKRLNGDDSPPYHIKIMPEVEVVA